MPASLLVSTSKNGAIPFSIDAWSGSDDSPAFWLIQIRHILSLISPSYVVAALLVPPDCKELERQFTICRASANVSSVLALSAVESSFINAHSSLFCYSLIHACISYRFLSSFLLFPPYFWRPPNGNLCLLCSIQLLLLNWHLLALCMCLCHFSSAK